MDDGGSVVEDSSDVGDVRGSQRLPLGSVALPRQCLQALAPWPFKSGATRCVLRSVGHPVFRRGMLGAVSVSIAHLVL